LDEELEFALERELSVASKPFVPVSIENVLHNYHKANPAEDLEEYRENLLEAVHAKKLGAVCGQCGSPIWAIGTATVGWNGCFSCITGEADCSEDYEIESVCF
jgi:hypothetical protein